MSQESGVRGQSQKLSIYSFITFDSSLFSSLASRVLPLQSFGVKSGVVYDLITDNPAVGIEAIPNYSNATFSQKVLSEDEFSKRVEVIVDISNPLASKTPFPLPASALSDELKRV